MSQIAILHPGQMGAALGRLLVAKGHDVGWLPAGRSAGTCRRADESGLRQLDDLDDRDVVLCVCPPAAALDTARTVAGFRGIYVDANAVSPATARDIAAVIEEAGGAYVDGGIIGPPPQGAGTTRLYLSGDRAANIAAIFKTTPVQTVLLGDYATTASAVKMTYAAWTKITAALLVSIRRTAQDLGVEDALVAEWARSLPDLDERYVAALRDTQQKGWRWAEEMRQVAQTFAASGQPPGFAQAAAEQFTRWPRPVDE